MTRPDSGESPSVVSDSQAVPPAEQGKTDRPALPSRRQRCKIGEFPGFSIATLTDDLIMMASLRRLWKQPELVFFNVSRNPDSLLCRPSALVLAGLVMGMIGCGRKPIEPVIPPPPEVTVSQPVVKPVTEFYEYIGRMEAPDYVEVRARVTGYLTKILFSDGKEVAAGEPLFEIDQRPYQYALDNARARLRQAEAQLKLADIGLDRNKTLINSNSISQQDLDESIQQQANAASEVQAATAAVSQAELDLEFCTIKAPIAGRLSQANVTVGNLISSSQSNTQPLTTIASVDPIHVSFDVDELAVLRFRERRRQQGDRVEYTHVKELNQKVLLALANETEFKHEGILDFIDNQVRSTTGTLMVRAEVKNPERIFVPGFFVRIRVPFGDATPTILVPDRAIQNDQDKKYVLIVDDQGLVHRRDVDAGPLDGPFRMIRGGLDADDKVITNGIQRARPGAKVTATDESLPSQDGKGS